LVESFATAQWERWWGESGNTVGAAQRERDGRGVHVVGSNVPVTSEVLREVAKDAGRRGLVAVDVVAPIWDLPLESPGPEPSVLTRLRLGPELPSQDLAFEAGRATELPRIDLRLHGLPTGEVTLELAGYRFDHPDRLPRALQQAVRAELDYVDAWWVAWDAPDDPPLLELGSFRTHRHRVLQTKLGPHRYVGPGPFRLRVRLVDVLHQSTEVAIELQRRERGLAIVQGRLRTVL
jgi:hypothetical protein